MLWCRLGWNRCANTSSVREAEAAMAAFPAGTSNRGAVGMCDDDYHLSGACSPGMIKAKRTGCDGGRGTVPPSLSLRAVVLSEAVELAEAEAPGASVDAVTIGRYAGAKVAATKTLVVCERHVKKRFVRLREWMMGCVGADDGVSVMCSRA